MRIISTRNQRIIRLPPACLEEVLFVHLANIGAFMVLERSHPIPFLLVGMSVSIEQMRILKVICILFCLMSVVSAITGVQSVHSSMRATPGAAVRVTTIVTRGSGTAARLWAIFMALVFAVAAYGIHKKASLVWSLGWVVLALSVCSS